MKKGVIAVITGLAASLMARILDQAANARAPTRSTRRPQVRANTSSKCKKESPRDPEIARASFFPGSRPVFRDPTVSSRKVRNYSMQIHYITPRKAAMRRDRGLACT
jgi:hypothetical protein